MLALALGPSPLCNETGERASQLLPPPPAETLCLEHGSAGVHLGELSS